MYIRYILLLYARARTIKEIKSTNYKHNMYIILFVRLVKLWL